MRRALRHNAEPTRLDDVSVLLDAIEQENGAVIVPMFERIYAGPPSVETLFLAATDALHLQRVDQAEWLFKQARDIDRWAHVPEALRQFAPLTIKSAREEIAHAEGFKKKRLARGAYDDDAGIVFMDADADPYAERERRWWVFPDREAAVKYSIGVQYRFYIEDLLVPGMTPAEARQAKQQASQNARMYAEDSLGESLGISPGYNGKTTASGYFYFDRLAGQPDNTPGGGF